MKPSALYWEVLNRVLESEALGDAGTLVAAAMDGPDALSTALDRPVAPAAGEGPTAGRGKVPEVWLRRVLLSGFRGIGPQVELDLEPAPGLVLVVGRNGSGKSSLAEGLEVLVTGNAHRLKDLSQDWHEGWRNLHTPEAPRLEAQLAVEGRGQVTLTRTWSADASRIPDGELTVREAGNASTLAALGWDEALDAYRPFLGTGELARGLDKGPSVVFDALQGILGLHEVTAAGSHLSDAKKALKKRVDDVKKRATELADAARQVDDARAEPAARALKARTWDLDHLDGLSLGDDEPQDVAGLAAVVEVQLGSLEAFTGELDACRAALDRVQQAEGTMAEQERLAAEVLSAALAWHDVAGDGDCPVCRSSLLDTSWRARAQQWRDRHAEAARVATEARQALQGHETTLRAWARAVPEALNTDVLDTAAAREAWARLSDARELRGVALADALEECVPDVLAALEALRGRAAEALEARRDRWRPFALQLGAWVADARAVADLPDQIKLLDAASKWLKATESELRDRRFEPLAQEACAIWALLRQGSHVDLAKVSLAGTGTRRKVELNVTVDGADSVALGVMSQGEVNALALSLFLPRMTSAGSPFRFLVIDDPVQAMDPHKVDGLAKVLHGVAATRQVVVLTHDPRLFEAVRRLRIPARVIELQRRGTSVVELRDALDPVAQHLEDARQVTRNASKLGTVVPGRVVPGLCRAALEAQLVRMVRRRRLGRGEPFADVQALLEDNKATNSLAALALFDEAHRGAEVMPRLDREGRWAADVYRALRESTHHGYAGDLEGLVRNTRSLVERLERLS